MKNIIGGLGVLFLVGCGEEAKTTEETKVDCNLSLDGLSGSEWVLSREITGMDPELDFKSRIQFFDKDGLKAKYTAGSKSDVYEYNCTKDEANSRYICRNAPDYLQWCQTLMANNRKCNLKLLSELDSTVTENDEMKKAIEEATKIHNEQKAGDNFDRYKRQFNNLGNKLQGILYVTVDQNKCRLSITDNFMTFVDKKRMEDSNINGTSGFVKNPGAELLWEDCSNTQLFDTTLAEYPENPEDIRLTQRHPVGTEIHYWLLNPALRYAEEGCTYSFNTYYNYKADKKGLKPESVSVSGKDELRWHFSKKFDAESPKGKSEIMMLTAQVECSGKPKQVITSCNESLIMPDEPVPAE